MKEHLSTMHKSMSKEVIKRLVVSIKRMETDLTFYENNWHLFRSPNLDYVPGLADIEEQLVEQPVPHQQQHTPKYKSMRPKNLSQSGLLLSHSRQPFSSYGVNSNENSTMSGIERRPSQPRRKIYHH
mmetsp:Transcript_35914/g.47252  ORF Transcript_35914/g.47252 Transcript_35914/m.47252 type:complete len:127 (+) Transcript_35914:2155-2535(+)